MIGSIIKGLFGRRASAAPDARACLEALHSGELQTAIDCFRDHLSRHPEDAAAYNNLGVALQRRGRGAEALACYETAMRLAPGNADGWYNAAMIHHLSKRIDRAEAHYRQALELDPALAEAHRDYSMLRLARGGFFTGSMVELPPSPGVRRLREDHQPLRGPALARRARRRQGPADPRRAGAGRRDPLRLVLCGSHRAGAALRHRDRAAPGESLPALLRRGHGARP